MRHVCTSAALAAAILVPVAAGAQDLGPRPILPLHIVCTDLPVLTMQMPALAIAGAQSPDARYGMATGETAVIPGGTSQGLAVGQRYVARRAHARPEALLPGRDSWHAMHPTGILTITAVDDRFALARVDSACDSVEIGDGLEPLTLPVIPAVAAAGGAANFDDRARVLFGKDRRELFADGDLLSIDRGTSHGIVGGTHLSVYRDRENGLPLVFIGDGIIVEVGADTSRAVMVRVLDFVQGGDIVVMRAAP